MSKSTHHPEVLAALEQLRSTYDTTRLLHLIDHLDQVCAALADPDALRADLLRLHAMAHAVINGGPLSVASSPAAIGELAAEIHLEIDQLEGVLGSIRCSVRPLEALSQ